MKHLIIHSLLFICLTIPTIATQAASVASQGEQPFTTGFARGDTADPMGGKMSYGIWYPSKAKEATIILGPFRFAGTQNAKPASGNFPLVILSHGSEGTYLGHRNIAIELARRGVIAVAPLHPRDNFRDASGTGHRIVWDGRPRQISAVIDSLLADKHWGNFIDQDKIGVFGFSLGGYTALSLLGAQYDLQELIAHCEQHLNDDPLCRLRGGLAEAIQSVYEAEYQGKAPVASHKDPRIKVAVIADPVAAVFSQEALAGLADIPLSLYLPEYGNELAAEFNGGRVSKVLSQQSRIHQPSLKIIAKARHMSFLAPFPKEVARTIPGLEQADGFNWEGFQQQFAVEVANFFVDKLNQ